MTDTTRLGFGSVLFPDELVDSVSLAQAEPDCFRDVNLDQIVSTLTTGRAEYELAPMRPGGESERPRVSIPAATPPSGPSPFGDRARILSSLPAARRGFWDAAYLASPFVVLEWARA